MCNSLSSIPSTAKKKRKEKKNIRSVVENFIIIKTTIG
jgi:hypothetical protein